MITADYAGQLARYNSWMNEKLMAACATLPDAARQHDQGAYFGSIDATLSHLLWADGLWLSRFEGRAAPTVEAPLRMFSDFAAYCSLRRQCDTALSNWATGVTAEWLASECSWYSSMYQRHFSRPAWLLVAHLFNHQTHHRAQIGTLLKQQGIDPGVTDLAFMD